MHLKADDGEARSRKHFDHTARSQIWELEIVGLNQDECLFDLRVRRKTDGAIQNAAVGIGKLRPEFQIALDCLRIESCQHAGLKISHIA